MGSIHRAGLITAATFAAATAASAFGQTTFTGAGEESELDCDGGSVRVEGADNMLTIHGRCTSLIIEGASNRITIDLGAQSTIRVTGAGNQIRWTAPAQAKPRVRVTGAANTIARIK